MANQPITAYPIPGFTEPFSSLSHLLGAVVFLGLATPLLRRGRGRPERVAALGVFVGSVVFLLLVSGAYHLLPPATPERLVLRRLDHTVIFAVIAGSFTPPHIILFRGRWRWGVLLPVWGLALTGMTMTVFFLNAIPEWCGLAFYLGLGWIGAISGIKLWRCYGFDFIRPVLWGGLAYTIGAVMDFTREPVLIPGVIQAHELFHLAVLAGMAFHWRFMMRIADGRYAVVESKESCSEGNIALKQSG